MNKSRNIVVEGAYEGQPVAIRNEHAFIVVGPTNFVALNRNNTFSVELIDSDFRISVPSAAVRGFVGEMLFGPIGLAGAATANRNNRFVIKITFKNRNECQDENPHKSQTVSILEVDKELLDTIQRDCR